MEIQFNLGLKNNMFSRANAEALITSTFNAFKGRYKKEYFFKADLGSYTNDSGTRPEPTLIGKFNMPDTVNVLALFRALADIFTQECIAVKVDGVGSLEYSNTYQGERQEFSQEYFIDYKEETILDDVMSYESGQLNDLQTVELFGKLIASGMVWKLQGHYGRTASRLMDWGAIDSQGNVNYDFLDSVAFM